MQPVLAVGRGLVMVSVRSPGPPGGSHSSPLPQHRARPHLQGEFSVVLPTASLVAPVGASRSPVEGAHQAPGLCVSWMGVPLWAAVRGGGGMGVHLRLTRCPTKRRQAF